MAGAKAPVYTTGVGVGRSFSSGGINLDRCAVVDVMQIGWQAAGRDRVEVVVVALDPVDRRAERLVAALIVGDVADAQPERNLGMARDDTARRIERAVDVAESAETYLLTCAGTSRSVLSQMKSLLL
jgi:hypothetical protein